MSADFLPLADWLRVVARQEGSTGKPFSDAADTITALYEALLDLSIHAGHLVKATDGMSKLRMARRHALDAMIVARAALKQARGEEA